MELHFEKQPCRYLRRSVWEAREQEQTQEVRLPEGMPDIGTVLGAWGQCIMRSKEWNTDSISTSGGVMAWVLYAPADGGAPAVVEAWLPVQLKWNMAGSERMGSICCSWRLKGMDGRTLSARKLMVRANVSVMAQALEPWEAELSVAPEVPEDVQLLKNMYPARLSVEAGEKAFVLDEEMELPFGASQPQRLIRCTMEPQITEQKVQGERAVLRGTGNCHLLYQDAEGQLHSHIQAMPFSVLADLDRDYDQDGRVSTSIAVTSLEPELQDGRLRIKCGLIAQYVIDQQKMLELVEDAYSPRRKVSAEVTQLRLPMMLDQRQEKLELEGVVDGKCARAVDTAIYLEHPSVRRAGDLTELVCTGQVQVLCYDENGSLQGRSGRWSKEWEMPASMDAELIGTVQAVGEPEVSPGAEQMQISADVMLEAMTVSQQPIGMVCGLELGELTNKDMGRPSLILRRAGAASVWEIAKNAGSTVEAIYAANGLTGEPLDDRLLLIPVY